MRNDEIRNIFYLKHEVAYLFIIDIMASQSQLHTSTIFMNMLLIHKTHFRYNANIRKLIVHSTFYQKLTFVALKMYIVLKIYLNRNAI